MRAVRKELLPVGSFDQSMQVSKSELSKSIRFDCNRSAVIAVTRMTPVTQVGLVNRVYSLFQMDRCIGMTAMQSRMRNRLMRITRQKSLRFVGKAALGILRNDEATHT